MAVRRNKPNPKPADSAPTVSADPYAPKAKNKESTILKVAEFMRQAFSHKGMFWLGVVVAGICFAGNLWFYITLFRDLVPDFALWQYVGLGALASVSTTLFELMPFVMRRGRKMTLQNIFRAGAKPKDLPELNHKVVGDADELIEDYRNSDRKTREFFEAGRWVAIFIETVLGVIFLGSLGTGFAALIKLGLFVASIFGCEWGVTLALRAAEWELPPQIRQQLDELIANAGKALKLNQI
ncbi:hypothetical protein [Leptolyngbya sp. FACHB-16]|uniref:hypothetical protein n=1 Tax=unclassified Leptolyngbya TaxID=2650499 RepID=UPI00168332A6|nr:hypothetical protein [Leptolyngbya sp. FACHB-16]MBD2156257.1 hypothetical protein [Leptolyngbya sp. FACHB-16]